MRMYKVRITECKKWPIILGWAAGYTRNVVNYLGTKGVPFTRILSFL